MTDIRFTFTGPMTIHIHVYPGAEPPVITAPETPTLEPAEPLDAAPGPRYMVSDQPAFEAAAPEPPAPAVERTAVLPAQGPRGGVRKVCPICGRVISPKFKACNRHALLVRKLLAANTPLADWPTVNPQPTEPDPPAEPAVERTAVPPPSAQDATASSADPRGSTDPPADPEPAKRSRIPAFLRGHLPTGRRGDRDAGGDPAYTELDLSELHGSRIA